MSVVQINYNLLEDIVKYSKRTAAEIEDYFEGLSNKVKAEYSGIEGGSSSNTRNSEDYVEKKIKKLKNKKQNYENFASDVNSFVTSAQEIDKRVARKIDAEKDSFANEHKDYIKNDWKAKINEFLIDIKNSCPVFNAIGDLIRFDHDLRKNVFAELKRWYKLGGGKEWVDFGLAVAGAITAVVLAVCACVPPICGIVAICAAIGAVLSAVNAITNLATSTQALAARENGDPGWAKVYGDRNTMQDVLRDNRWTGSMSGLNKWGGLIATGLDVTQFVCSVVAIGNSIKNLKDTFTNIKANYNGSFGKGLKAYLFNGKTADGKSDMLSFINDKVKENNKMNMVEYLKSIGKGGLAEQIRNPSDIKQMFNDLSDATKVVGAGVKILSNYKDVLFGEKNVASGLFSSFNELSYEHIKPVTSVTGLVGKGIDNFKKGVDMIKNSKYVIKPFVSYSY